LWRCKIRRGECGLRASENTVSSSGSKIWLRKSCVLWLCYLVIRSMIWNLSIAQITVDMNFWVLVCCFTFWGTSFRDTLHFVEWWNSNLNQFSSPVTNLWYLSSSWPLRMDNNSLQASIRIYRKLVVNLCRIRRKRKISYQVIPANKSSELSKKHTGLQQPNELN
jgi:hypothetical protein